MSKKNKNRKAFSMIEILVVIAIVAVFSSIVIANQSNNKEMEISMEKEKILMDLSHLKKESLLFNNESSSVGSIMLTNNSKGYQTTYAGNEKGFLNITSIEKVANLPEYRFILKTDKTNSLLHPYVLNSKQVVKDLYNDISNTLPTFPSSGTETTITLSSTQASMKLDIITTFYLQNPNNIEERSNHVIYRFFSDKNLNVSELDDVILKITKINGSPLDENTVYALTITFDRFGSLVMKDKDGNSVTSAEINMQEINSNSSYTITIPNDI